MKYSKKREETNLRGLHDDILSDSIQMFNCKTEATQWKVPMKRILRKEISQYSPLTKKTKEKR